jgi:hypothetical protein
MPPGILIRRVQNRLFEKRIGHAIPPKLLASALFETDLGLLATKSASPKGNYNPSWSRDIPSPSRFCRDSGDIFFYAKKAACPPEKLALCSMLALAALPHVIARCQ